MPFLVRLFAPSVFFSLVCGTFVDIRSAETVTVVPSGGKAAELIFADLLTVALANRPELQVVERNDIPEVLQEQRISAFGERSDSLLLGHLLGVDMFVVWEDHSEDGLFQQKFSGRLVCFDGATGVRLGDTVMAGQDLMEMAERACKHVVTAVSKHTSMEKQGLRLLSIASIRNVDVPLSLRDQFPGLVRSVERAIAEHPEAALLERDRLRFVMREQDLPVARKQARLLAAAHTLTIEFARSGGAVKTIVRLHHNDRTRPVEAEWGSPNGPNLPAATRAISQIFSQIKFARTEFASARDTAAEAERLSDEATRLSREGNSLGAAVRMEAAVLLEETTRRLTYLKLWLGAAVFQRLKESLEESGGTMAGVSYAPGGELRSKWSFPDDAWLEAIQIADYRILIADQLSAKAANNQSSRNDLFGMVGFHIMFSSLDHERQPEVVSAARAHLDRFEESLVRRLAAEVRRQQRKSSPGDASFTKLAVLLTAKRHVMTDWERDFLRYAVPGAFQSTSLFGPNLDNVLTTMTPRSRDLFFRKMRPLETGELTPISTMFQLMHLKMDRKWGSPTQKATISARVEKLAFAFVDQLCRIKLRKGGGYGGQPLRTASGPISVPSQYASGLKHLDEVLNYHSDAHGRAKLTADVTGKLLEHRIVHLPLLRFASAGSESGRALIAESLRVIDEHGAGYEGASRRRMHSELLKKLSTKSSHTSPVAKTSTPRKLEVIFPLLEGTRSDRRIIHALPTPDAIYLLTRHQDPKTQDWIVESARINGGLKVPLSQHTVSKQTVDQFETRIRSIRFQGMDRPRDFFELQLSSAFARLHDKQIFLPTAGGGILVFPLSGDTPFAIDDSWGLPSNCIQAFDFAHDNLFVWVGIPGKEGALMYVDLARRKSRLLISAQRERKAVPLDDFPGAKCSGVLYHGKPDKLYLLVSGILFDERNGLWSVDLRNGTFRPLLTGKFHIGTPRRQGSQLQFVKTGNVGGKVFRYLVTADLESATVTERKVTELPDSNASPLGNAGKILVWSSFMAPYCVIEDRQDLDIFTRRSFLKLLPGEYLRHISLEGDGETVLLYSNRRGWKTTLKELATKP